MNRLRLSALAACFLVSGVAGLIYQSAWMRQFALVFGTSELAVATVLAAFMLGLAFGALLMGRQLARVRQPLRGYAWLEAGIAVWSVLLVPLQLWAARWLLTRLFGGEPQLPASQWSVVAWFNVGVALLVLLPPTALMGATLPLLARAAVHSTRQIGVRIGLLYACNTAGAVLGALLTAWWLLPHLGLRGTIEAAAALNLVVAGVALLLQRRAPAELPASAPEPLSPTPVRWHWTPGPTWVLPLMLLSGAVAFLHEVLWTRMLSHLLGSSQYAFGVMLASFLSGIALGGLASTALARERVLAARALVGAQLLIAATAVISWQALTHWLPSSPGLAVNAWFGLGVLLPLAFCIGSTYPLAVRVLACDVADSARASARVLVWNTLGAVLGALLGGFVLIPALRYEGALQLTVILSAVLACTAALLLPAVRPRAGLIGAVPVLLLALLFRPSAPQLLLHSSPLAARDQGALLFYRVGRSATVTINEHEDLLLMRNNGLPEASIPRRGAPPVSNGEQWMPALAVLSRPEGAQMLMIGLGAGRMLEAVPPSVDGIDVIELEPQVVVANQAVLGLRNADPLRDSRVHVVLNDARAALTLSPRRYDAIISQPSHPWTAGASHLYTREFMLEARAHLNPNGVFVQWMNRDFLDAALLRSLISTLCGVFTQVQVYQTDAQTLVFVAALTPLDSLSEPRQLQATIDRSPRHYLKIGIGAAEAVVAALVLDSASARQFAASAEPITDDHNRLANSRVFEQGRGLTAASLARLLAPFDPLATPHSAVYTPDAPALDFDYIGRRLVARGDAGARARLSAMAQILSGRSQGEYLQALLREDSEGKDAAQGLLDAALLRFPQDDELRYALIRPHFGELAQDRASPALQGAAAQLSAQPGAVLAAARAAVQGQWAQVAALDASLAAVPLTAAWSAEATQLRVEWRLRESDPQQRGRLCDEALRLIDESALMQPNMQLRVLRAWAGAGVERADVVLESIAAFAHAVPAGRADSMERAAQRQALPGLQRLLQQIEQVPQIDHARWLTVRNELQQAAARL